MNVEGKRDIETIDMKDVGVCLGNVKDIKTSESLGLELPIPNS